ncbi:MAG TPA: Wzz/FepE/Etk N-terminal domain-containing protein, partial [Steroidobacteraceae bacterium]
MALIVDVRAQIPITREQVSLKEVLQVLWLRRWRATGFTATLVALALIAAWLAPRKYEASILVDPVTQTPGESQMGGLRSMMSQFSGLGALAGLSLGSDSHRAETIAVLQSRQLTEQYIDDNHLLPILYAKRWDSRLKRWNTSKPKKIPTLWKANEYFKHSIRSVTESKKTGLVTLTITWKDPQLAAAWANGLVEAANDYLRAQAIGTSDRNIAYLKAQAAQTDDLGIKQAIYLVLENEIDDAMLARGKEQYALKVLDPAAAPDKPSFPQPVLWSL